MDSWDRYEWQGRSRKQVENNQKISGWSLILLVVILLLHLLILFFSRNFFWKTNTYICLTLCINFDIHLLN